MEYMYVVTKTGTMMNDKQRLQNEQKSYNCLTYKHVIHKCNLPY